MKNIILGSVLTIAAVTSITAQAEAFCAGGPAGASTVTAAAADTSFVKVAFTPKCSANVFLQGDDRSATVYTVGAASVKGKTYFGGTSEGGSVGNVGECDKTAGCKATDAAAGSDKYKPST